MTERAFKRFLLPFTSCDEAREIRGGLGCSSKQGGLRLPFRHYVRRDSRSLADRNAAWDYSARRGGMVPPLLDVVLRDLECGVDGTPAVIVEGALGEND